LPSQVKLLCEPVHLNLVYNGECFTYLFDKATGIVQHENPYHCAIEIAKIIDLSGPVLNISGYNTLRLGVEAKQMGRLLA
jgi:hypothetical protein